MQRCPYYVTVTVEQNRRWHLFRSTLLALFCCACTPKIEGACELANADVDAVRAAAAEYVAAWLSNDNERLKALLSNDIILMPHHGSEQRVGRAAVEEFWFSPDYPPSVITAFEQDVLEVKGCGDFATVRGKQDNLEWDYDGDQYRNRGSNFISIYRKQRDGAWLLSLQIWNSLETEKISDD